MYKNILVAADGSDMSNAAVEHAITLAADQGATLTLVSVTELWSASDIANRIQAGQANAVEDFESHAAEAANKILDAAAAKASARNVTCKKVHVKDEHPAEGIIKTANAEGCDLIVMSTHGRRGIRRMLLGSVAAEVVTTSKVPVLIHR